MLRSFKWNQQIRENDDNSGGQDSGVNLQVTQTLVQIHILRSLFRPSLHHRLRFCRFKPVGTYQTERYCKAVPLVASIYFWSPVADVFFLAGEGPPFPLPLRVETPSTYNNLYGS